jgi:NADH-quinone oxidoreductase subunit F
MCINSSMNHNSSSHMTAFEPVLTRNIHRLDSEKISTYLAYGGYQAVRKALTHSPDEIIQMVKRSGLRGRGGAGFPAGVKWGFMPKGNLVLSRTVRSSSVIPTR